MRMIGAKGFTRIAAIADGVEAVISARDEGRRRFEIMARQVFVRFKALVMEPAAFTYAGRHDNIEAIYKKLEERRDTADVTEVLKALHRIVNEAIRAQDDRGIAAEQAPSRFYAVKEGLTEEELALFDLLHKPPLRKATRERLKLASKSLLASVKKLIAPLERWTEKEQTKALVESEILDHLFQVLPSPPFTDEEKQAVAKKVYEHVWQQSAGGQFRTGGRCMTVAGVDVGGAKKGFHAIALRDGQYLSKFAARDAGAVADWCRMVGARSSAWTRRAAGV